MKAGMQAGKKEGKRIKWKEREREREREREMGRKEGDGEERGRLSSSYNNKEDTDEGEIWKLKKIKNDTKHTFPTKNN